MSDYLRLKKEQGDALNNAPIFFAFGNEQFKEQLEKRQLTTRDIYSIGGGGYIKKSDAQSFADLLNSQRETMRSALLASFDFAYSAFLYELRNHEFGLTWDSRDTLDALQITDNDLNDNATLRKALRAAIKAIEAEEFGD